MKISIITPSYNSGASIEKAIESVLAQGSIDYEHIIVDGGSTDQTLEVIRRYPHLRVISEPDRGQVHAMNKGFAMAKGEIIGYLNADDHYNQGAFSAVLPHFSNNEKVVMGRVLVRSEKAGGINEWICDPGSDFHSMLRHWEMNAFCVNPVGYFYRREIQEKIAFREETGAMHDLAFLIEVSQLFPIKKIDQLLGVFNHQLDTQTGREQLVPGYWQPEKFSFISRMAENLPASEKLRFKLDQEKGYQLRRYWTAREALSMGLGKELFEQGEIFLLPEGEDESAVSRCGFVEHDRLATKGDWIIPVLTMGKVASKSICQALKSLPMEILPAQVYHVHQVNPKTINNNLPGCLPALTHPAVGLALKNIYDRNSDNKLKWKFIAGVRDPIMLAISGVFEIAPDSSKEQVNQKIDGVLKYLLSYFSIQYNDALGINIYDYTFDCEKGYSIIDKGNRSILLFRLEDLPRIFSSAMADYLGIDGLELKKVNVGKEKPYGNIYQEVLDTVKFSKTYLDEVYSSELVRHFYSEQEIDSFYRRWQKGNEKNEYKKISKTKDLIYDIGMHVGQDTEFYLKKGFRVVAVDANPLMIEEAEKKFSSYLESGQLKLLNLGVVEKPTREKLTFYVNERCTEWSSFVPEIAGRDGGECRAIQVPCSTMEEIITEHGKPYYVKIDIEGFDHIAIAGLNKSCYKPLYVSVENGHMGMVNSLTKMGYTKFKYVQQNNVAEIRLPFPPLEGDYVEHTFPAGASGPFGEETTGEWKNADEIKQEIARVWDPEGFKKNPEHKDEIDGWFDLHAKLEQSSINA